MPSVPRSRASRSELSRRGGIVAGRDADAQKVEGQLDATAATHQENYKESQLYTLGGKQRTRAPSPDAELEYMFVMSMVVQYRRSGSVRCGQRRSRARALADR